MTSPNLPARVPILDDNDRLYPEQLPATPPQGWGATGGASSIDDLTGVTAVGKAVAKAVDKAAGRAALSAASDATATRTTAGIVRLATVEETKAGEATVLAAITPDGLKAVLLALGAAGFIPLVYTNGAYPARPTNIPAGSIPVWLGPVRPAAGLAGDLHLNAGLAP